MISDEQLALQLKQGNREALAVLAERHYDALLGYLYRRLWGDRALAEDLAQETFMRVLSASQQYQYPRPFKAWLYAIALNLVRNHHASADTRRVVAVPDTEDDVLPLVEEDGAGEAILLAQDENNAVIAALAALPETQREVILFYYYAALDMPAIAEALDIPLGTVKSRMAAGIKRLREGMKEAL